MKSKLVTIINKEGLHMRPAGIFVKEMKEFKCDVNVLSGDNKLNGKGLMGLVAACLKFGHQIEIQCDGEDESLALDKAISLIESGFGE